ncbi:hypothetical protein [Cellulomonas soli]|uniref:Uncharacterized protein n=1 Tax=Cellulomonas soli TaxID=931535 RepID=A0A512PDY0_9CELL|nr:hypothetical protein [Cellulomonas soli]NYI59101.1 hypothetical protein [Cellulomonas soli]GEP69408.1 hypothetical protein CSO01_21230 [Cellulomonas soli]
MREVDEQDATWAREVFARATDGAPDVSVDVPTALRRGRRRRAVRAVGVPGAFAIGVLGAVLMLPHVVPGPTPAAVAPTATGVSATPSPSPSDGAAALTDLVEDARREAEHDRAVEELLAQREAARIAAEAAAAAKTPDDYLELGPMTADSVVELFALAEVPDVDLVRVIPSDRWPARMDRCMQDRGGWHFAAVGEGGWRVGPQGADQDALGAALYACLVMFPEEP